MLQQRAQLFREQLQRSLEQRGMLLGGQAAQLPEHQAVTLTTISKEFPRSTPNVKFSQVFHVEEKCLYVNDSI